MNPIVKLIFLLIASALSWSLIKSFNWTAAVKTVVQHIKIDKVTYIFFICFLLFRCCITYNWIFLFYLLNSVCLAIAVIARDFLKFQLCVLIGTINFVLYQNALKNQIIRFFVDVIILFSLNLKWTLTI